MEIVALSNRRRNIKRVGGGLLSLLEILTVALCLAAILTMLLVDIGASYEGGTQYQGYIADPWRLVVVGFQGVIGYEPSDLCQVTTNVISFVYCILLIFSCASCCQR